MSGPHKIIEKNNKKKNETLVAVSVITEGAFFSALPAEIANYRMSVIIMKHSGIKFYQ